MPDPQANSLVTGRGEQPVIKTVTGTTNTNTAATIVAAVTGKLITPIGLHVSGGNTTGGVVSLKDGASGTVKAQAFVVTTSPWRETAEAGGYLFRGTAATLLELRNDSNGVAYWNLRYVEETP